VFRQFGAQELLIILLIVVLLFGAKKLPETARGLGRSLRIFKAETKGLTDDDTEAPPAPAQPAQMTAQQVAPPPAAPQQIAAPPAQPPTASADPAAWPASSPADERS
jgi:sec-independent protein translocase protein TatA